MMKASDAITELMQAIIRNGGDFELAIEYLTEIDLKNHLEDGTTDEEIKELLEKVQNRLSQQYWYIWQLS